MSNVKQKDKHKVFVLQPTNSQTLVIQPFLQNVGGV